MKKLLISVILIFTLLLSCLPAVFAIEGETLTETETETDTVSIVLRPENFTQKGLSVLKQPASSEFNKGALEKGDFFYFRDNNFPNGDTKRVYANIYVSTPGTYNIWAMTKDFTTQKGTRWIQLSVDGITNDYKFNSQGKAVVDGVEGWLWENGFAVELTAGWHIIEVAKVNSTPRLCAVMITNDATFDPNGKDYTTEINPYEDSTKPSFGEGAELALDFYDSGSIIAQWPQATDENGVAGYALYINGSETPVALEPDTQSYIIDGLSQLEALSVKIEAFDAHGNKQSLEDSTIFGELDLKDTAFTDENGNKLSDMSSSEISDEITAVFGLKNKTNNEKTLLLGIAVYDKSTGAMITNSRKSITLSGYEEKAESITVEVTDEISETPGNYKVYAALWDSEDNIAPQVAGILME